MLVQTKVYPDGCYDLRDYYNMLPGRLRAWMGGFCDIMDDEGQVREALAAYGHAGGDSLAVYEFEDFAVRRARVYITSAENLLHEAGHVLDMLLGGRVGLSGTAGFKALYRAVFDKSGFSAYFASTPREFFAESFCQYILCREGLEDGFAAACPDVHAYFVKLIEQYEAMEVLPWAG